MRSTFISLLITFPALGILNAWWFGRELRAFVTATPSIASTADIERMRSVVKRQMIAALIQIPLLAAGPILYGLGLLRHVLRPGDVVFVIVPSAAVLALGLASKRIEAAARALPAPDHELRRQRDAIVHTWLKKPLPDW
ncbi:MAG: hypothetical protein C3F15_00895 [Holophagae bacterium]|nr:MAG: hypothetical protein C3F15_00895 [Holophagae bacterium]